MNNHQHTLHNIEIVPPAAVWSAIVDELNQHDETKTIANSLYHTATTPPVQVWENIHEQLNEAQPFLTLENKLHHIEVAPPVAAWSQIAGNLDAIYQERKLAAQIHDIEVMPPAHLWNNIQQKMDESTDFTVAATTLQSLEIEPPIHIWENIQAQISDTDKKEDGAKIIPISTAHNPWKKYIAVAASVALLVLLGIRYSNFDNNNENTSLASSNIKEQPSESIHKSTTNITTAAADNNEPAFNHIKPDNTPDKNIITAITNKKSNAEEANITQKNEYIVLMTNDGEVVRLSKKAGNMARCISGEHADGDCNEKLKEIQKEVSRKTILSGPLDILTLANQEEKL